MAHTPLSIGTAQFGLDYGIANKDGQISQKEVENLLNYAQSRGIDSIDTAISYGNSEIVLGASGVSEWSIISKLPELPFDCANANNWVIEIVNTSLNRLRCSSLHGLLLHSPKQLIGPRGNEIWNAIKSLQKDGKVKKIGFSIYNPEELDLLIPKYLPDIVQAPYNIIDRTIAQSGWLNQLSIMNIEVHVRSVFLQGLLLMDKAERPIKFARWSKIWVAWDNWLVENNLTALEACIAFVMKDSRINKIIVGVDSVIQLKEIINASKQSISLYPHDIFSNERELINPSNWSNL